MATYVLVHGAWSGSWAYTPVAEALTAAGHDVLYPSLTGHGERAHLASPAITLSTHITDVVNLIEYRDLRNVILCGHSYGGMVITGAAARVGERIRTLVYIDAFLPRDGEALWDIADDPSRKHYIDAQRDMAGMAASFPMPPDFVPPRPIERHSLLTLTEPVRFSGEEAKVTNRTYIYATRGAPTVFTKFHERVKDDPAWRLHSIDTGHVVMAEDPEGLTALLLAEADR